MKTLLANSIIILVMQLQTVHLTRQSEDALDDRAFGWLILQTLQRGWTLEPSPDQQTPTITFTRASEQLVLETTSLEASAPTSASIEIDERPTLLLEIDHLLSTSLEDIEKLDQTGTRHKPTPAVYLMLEARASSPRADGLIEPLSVELLEAGVPLTGDPTHAVMTLCVYSHGFAVQLLDEPPEDKCGDGGDVWAMSEDAAPEAWRAKLTAHIKAKFETKLAAKTQKKDIITPAPIEQPDEGSRALMTSAVAGSTWRGSADMRAGLLLETTLWEKFGLATSLQVTPSLPGAEVIDVFEGDAHVGVSYRILGEPEGKMNLSLAALGGVWWHRWSFSSTDARGREFLPSASLPLTLHLSPWDNLLLVARVEAGACGGRITHTGDGETFWTRSALRVGAGLGVGWRFSSAKSSRK